MKNANGGCHAHKDIVSSLPALELSAYPWPLRKYQGIWLPEFAVAGTINIQHHFKARPTDILLSSYPKCGTTWLKALAFATLTRGQHSFTSHPLHHLNSHECMPLIEMECHDLERLSQINAVEAPQLLSTHLPFQMLPESIKSSSCRIVYICREPKDALVSGWHFFSKKKSPVTSDQDVSLDKFMEMYCEGICANETIWDHVLGYWNESLRAPERILILKYEEMLEAPLENLTKLAEFMGCPFNEEEINRGVHEQIVKLCSFNNLKDLAIQLDRPVNFSEQLTTDSFYRKGVVGDWKNNNISPEMVERIDQITKNKLLGTGLSSWVFHNSLIACFKSP